MSAHRSLRDMYSAPFLMTDPGAGGTITVDRWGAVIPLLSASGARTLAQPTKAGLQCLIEVDTYTSTCTLTVTGGYNQAADGPIIFGTAGDWVEFKSVKVGASYYWRILAQEGTNATSTGGNTVSSQTITALTSPLATISSLRGAVTEVAAAGSTVADAGALTANMINIVNSANNTTCVKLPVAVAGQVVIVKSSVASKTLPVFPQVSSYINGTINAAATLDSVAAGASAIFVASDATHWYTISGDLA